MLRRPKKSQNVIGPALHAARRQAELTQDALAARCTRLGWDCSENTVSKIETGERCITDEELVMLCRALRVQLHALFPNDQDLF